MWIGGEEVVVEVEEEVSEVEGVEVAEEEEVVQGPGQGAPTALVSKEFWLQSLLFFLFTFWNYKYNRTSWGWSCAKLKFSEVKLR